MRGLFFGLVWLVPSLLSVPAVADEDSASVFYRHMVDKIDARQYEQVEARATEQLSAALEAEDALWQAAAHAVFGELEMQRERYVAAIDQLVSCRELPESEFHDICTMRLAEVRWRLGQLPIAAELLLELAQRHGEAGDFAGQARIWNNLGIIHADLGDLEQAEDWFRTALDAYTDLGEHQLVALTLGNIAKVSHELGKLHQARRLIDQALAMADELDAPMNVAQQLHVSGSIHADRGDLDRALADFEHSLELSREAGHRGEVAHTQAEMARVLMLQDNAEAAVPLLLEALEVVEELGLLSYQIDIHRLLRGAYSSQGDFRAALEQAEAEIAGTEALVGQEKAGELARMDAIYRVQEAERRAELAATEARLAEEQLHSQRGLIAGLVVFVVMMAALVTLVFLRARERRQFERQAFARERQFKQDFSAMLVHDLRGPLQGIMMSAEQMHDQVTEPDSRRLADQILDACDTMIGLINDLLRFSKSESDRLVLSVRPISFAQIIEQSVSQVRTLADAKRVQLDVKLDSMGPLPIDEDRLRQVVDNLLRNAIRHSPKGGLIVVRLSRHDGPPVARQCLVIEDQGPGIPEKDLAHIFRPYFRSGKPGNQPDGFGLGLAISQLIIRAHGGEITAANLERAGARFEICLPESGTS